MRHFISLGFILLLTSCSTTNYYPKTVQSWNGGSAQKLVSKWGSPDQMVVSQNGNAVLTYKSSSYRPGVTNTGADCTATFEVNKDRKIVSAQYKGKRCWRDSNFAYYMSNNVSEA